MSTTEASTGRGPAAPEQDQMATAALNGIIQELETTLSSRSMASRADALKRITDLFVSNSNQYGDHAVALFGDVIMSLADAMETSVRAALSERMAVVPNAPSGLIRRLAFDDAVAVAGPVLSKSRQLTDAALVENAKVTSQEHLLAIAAREQISEGVTDVLLHRGDARVARSAVRNPGARFSTDGQELLVQRSQDDAELAVGVCRRADIPRHRVVRLFAAASDEVRKRLAASGLTKKDLVGDLVFDASNRMQTRSRIESHEYAEAQKRVEKLHRAGRLGETEVEGFASAGSFEDTVVALSLLCEVRIEVIERAMAQPRPELVLLLAKSVGFSWRTAKTLLVMRHELEGEDAGEEDLEESFNTYSRMQPETARKAVYFLRLRERARA